MSYDQTLFAFFDGSPQYRKALKPDDSIAGYKVTSITPDRVTLVAGTNEVELPLAKKELRREQGGDWRLAERRETYVATYSRPASHQTTVNPTVADPASDASLDPSNSDAGPFIPDGVLPLGLTDQPPGAALSNPAPGAAPAGGPSDILSRLRARAAAERGEAPQ